MKIHGVLNPNYNKIRDGYESKCAQMAEQFKAWRLAHPDANLKVQFNYPRKVVVCATLVDALKHSFVIIDEPARAMFKELGWLEDKPDQPSILMVRMVMEETQ